MVRGKKLIPVICEICGEDDKAVLHKHHIVERTDPDCTNDEFNLAVVCSNCHNKIHHGTLEVIGIFPSTKKPYGRTLVYKVDGVCNIPGLEEPYYKSKAKSTRLHWENKK